MSDEVSWTILGSGNNDCILPDTRRQDFVDGLVHGSPLLKQVRKLIMNRSRLEVPMMSLGAPITRSTNPPTFEPFKLTDTSTNYSSIVLNSTKLVLPWATTKEWLESNPDEAVDKLLGLMVMQAAVDIEDLLINGDEDSHDRLLRANDGLLRLAEVRTAARRRLFSKKPDVTRIFEKALKALPTKYRSNKNLRLIVGPEVWASYSAHLRDRPNRLPKEATVKALADFDSSTLTFKGIPLVVSRHMPSNTAILSHPDNILFGLGRKMKLRAVSDTHKDVERYYALHISCDFEIQNKEALVVTTIEDSKPRKLVLWLKDKVSRVTKR